jgi:hypothetical protein
MTTESTAKPRVSAAEKIFRANAVRIVAALSTMNSDQLTRLASHLHAELPRTARDLCDSLNRTKDVG